MRRWQRSATKLSATHQFEPLVFRGVGGKAFVAGTDISQFSDFKDGEDGITYEDKVETYLTLVEKLPVPTICVVEGWAVGGGHGDCQCL